MAFFHLGFPAPSISDLTLPGNAPLARQCERAGFDYLWHSNQRFHREMFTRMTSSAMVTERIGIGGAISEAFAVHPIITAQTLASLDELSGGRATLALGAGGSGFQMMGITRQHSAKVLKDALLIMKPLLAGQEVTYNGEFIQAVKARLEFKPIRPTPLWVATRGDFTLKMAGEHADGVIIATYATPDGVNEALALVEQGARSSGRSLGDLRVLSRVDTCVHADPVQAYSGSRGMVARFLWSSYPDRNFVHRAGLEVPPEVEVLISQRDYSLITQIAAQVPDELVAAFCWAGTPRMVADRVVALSRATGISEFGFWLLLAPGQSREQAVDIVASQVLPLIKAEL
jgi:5,10-methylenetetrahydromethanopterin reductase